MIDKKRQANRRNLGPCTKPNLGNGLSSFKRAERADPSNHDPLRQPGVIIAASNALHLHIDGHM